MTPTALLVMDVQQGIVDRFAGVVLSTLRQAAGLDRARPAAG